MARRGLAGRGGAGFRRDASQASRRSGAARGSTPAKGVAYGRSTSGAQLPRLSRGRRLGWGLLRWPGADGASAPRRAHLAPASRVEPARVTWLDSTSCWWSGVPVGGRRTKPEASTAAEEPAHGVQAPAEDVLAKRPNWQAGRLVWEGGRHGPARGLRQFGGVDLALLTFVLPLERLDGHVPGVLLRTGRVRTVRVAVLASHTSRIGTRALNLHERRGRRPAGGDSVDLPPQHRRDSVASAAGIRLGSGAPSHRAVQASSRYSETWMFSQLPRCAIDSARADRRLPASISRAGISLRRRGT